LFRSDQIEGEPEEWCIIELQGDLEVENGESLANKFMADLHYNQDGTPIMILG
jgi:chromosome transmission fidelity protein 8